MNRVPFADPILGPPVCWKDHIIPAPAGQDALLIGLKKISVKTDLLEMTVRLITAHLSVNPVAADRVPDFIQSVHKTLKQLRLEDAADGLPADPILWSAEPRPSPAAPAPAVAAAPVTAAPSADPALSMERPGLQTSSASAPDLLALAGAAVPEQEPGPAAAAEAAPEDAEGAPEPVAGPHDPAYAGLDPWLAQRIAPHIAKKLNRNGSIHPSLHYDHFVCLEDGRSVKLLKPHLERRCNMTLEEYIRKWNLPADFPAVTPAYRQKKGLPPLPGGNEPAAAPDVGVAPVIMTDISDAAYKDLDTWLAQRITPGIAKKLNPRNAIHPSVFPDHLICLEDGGKVTLLKSYLRKRFNLRLEDYIKRWNLPADYPSTPPRYIEGRRRLARKNRLGRGAVSEQEEIAEPAAPTPLKRPKPTRRVVTAARGRKASQDVVVEKVTRRSRRVGGTLSLFGKKE